MKEFKENFSKVCKPQFDKISIGYFDQLIVYIDGALKDTYKKEGDERISSLVAHLLNIRDFLSRSVTENSLRQLMLQQAINIIDQIENPPEEPKKNLNPLMEAPLDETDSEVEKNPDKDL